MDTVIDSKAICKMVRQMKGEYNVFVDLCDPSACQNLYKKAKTSGSSKIVVLACNNLQKKITQECTFESMPVYVYNVFDYVQYSNSDRELATKLILNCLPGFLNWVAEAEKEEKMVIPVDRSLAIIGESKESKVCCSILLKMNYKILRIIPAMNKIEQYIGSERINYKYKKLLALNGEVGKYLITFQLPDMSTIDFQISAIALADDYFIKKQTLPYKFTENESMSISVFTKLIKKVREIENLRRRCANGQNIIFVFSANRSRNPTLFSSNVFKLLLKLRAFDIPVVFIFSNMNVTEFGSEELYYQARKSGVRFIRFKDKLSFEKGKDGLLYTVCGDEDASLYEKLPWKIKTAMLVMEDSLEPSGVTESWGDLLKIPKGPDGFRMSDNIYYNSTLSNQRGIYVFGGSRKQMSAMEQIEQGEAAVAEINSLLGSERLEFYTNRIKYHKDKCSFCLTCLRNCPHNAIRLDGNNLIFSLITCTACGICYSGCPSNAISRLNYDRASFRRLIGSGYRYKTNYINQDLKSRIIVFLCQNSAAEAIASFGNSAYESRLPPNIHLVKLPCAAYLTSINILDVFNEGFSGILSFACHRDNCYYLKCNIFAEARIERMKNLMSSININKESLKIEFIAAHMGKQARDLIIDFAKSVEKIILEEM